jgi:cobalt/nickel transport system permease protein
MHIIDRYAYTNRIRRLDPAHKAALACLVIALCLLLSRPWVGLAAAAWMWALAVFWAGLPGRVFLRVLLAEGLFLCLAVVGVAVSVSSAPPPEALQGWQVGPLWLSTSPASLALAGLLVTRALGCAAAMNFLALTTPLVDMVELLRRWRVPVLLIDLMTIMYRYIFVLLESLSRMHTAQQSRLGYSTWWRSMRSAGLLGSRLFLDAYQRARRMQIALESRSYTGDLRVLPTSYQRDGCAWWFGALIGSSLLLAWML